MEQVLQLAITSGKEVVSYVVGLSKYGMPAV